jgi:RNA polymerase sigma factor (sigma-70 family)
MPSTCSCANTKRRLYAFVRRMVTDPDESKDVLQNVFLKAWNGLDRFREDAQLYSWLYRIAHNECITHLKRLRRGLFVSQDHVMNASRPPWTRASTSPATPSRPQLQRAVMTLPDKQRAVFTMKYFEELKYEEISAITGTSVGALKSSYHIAVKKIEDQLTRDRTK